MRTSEKTSKSRGFVSPSLSTDMNQPQEGGMAQLGSLVNASTALMVGKWAWRRLPRAGFFGLLAVGAYVGYRMMQKNQSTPASMIDKLKLH